ncbi:leucine-rich repeat-containing protein 15-like [Phlebotomus argentipes]|uniref:leucine-rich repeat-containing protein 15-like n=1 Tax=Phlebotomus argentipes TaxID=94469 RepID=UPI002892E27A|nr:leucine-rich repeat-containing protein 15-like [Phlebotomus argentipes]
MRREVACFLLCLLAVSVSGGDNNTTEVAAKKDDTKDSSVICSSCICDKDTNLLDCSERSFRDMLLAEDWTPLNKSFSVYVVHFTRNQLTKIPAFPELPIQELDFSHNEINTIEKRAFKELRNLVYLDLSNNRLDINSINPDVFEGHYDPDEYEPLNKLRTLKLDNNNIHALKSENFEHLPHLRSLSLAGNPFQVIDSQSEMAITSIRYLEFLDLSRMELSGIPPHLLHTPRALKTLNITDNLLTQIPDALVFAKNLENLYLDNNLIPSLGTNRTKFALMPNLQFLSLSSMPLLERVEAGAFSGLTGLKTLRMSENPKLYFIHGDAMSRQGAEDPSREEWPDLTHLYLHNNNLTTIDMMMLANWEHLEVLDIRHNPWLCDCSNQWMVDRLLGHLHGDTERLLEDVICEHPIEMRGTKMIDLENTQLRCVDKYGHRPEHDGVILMGMLIGILVGIPISLMIVLIYRRGCFGLLAPRGPADYSRAFYKRAGQDDMYY